MENMREAPAPESPPAGAESDLAFKEAYRKMEAIMKEAGEMNAQEFRRLAKRLIAEGGEGLEWQRARSASLLHFLSLHCSVRCNLGLSVLLYTLG